uniref:Uncharacterized protein n=1 Tax=Neolamprologus brichardi TaxID=32507 RepID=A0A3Q4HY63_NEOBR
YSLSLFAHFVWSLFIHKQKSLLLTSFTVLQLLLTRIERDPQQTHRVSTSQLQVFLEFVTRWSAWTPWGHCSVSCGAGLQSRYRFCSSPRPSGRGLPCTGPHHEDQVCIIAPKRHVFNVMRWLFPGDGGWCEWSEWTPCSRTCGAESVTRYRSCSCPEPEAGGEPCSGEQEVHILQCQSVPGCHVDGGWSQWGAWTECSLSCGGGVKFRRRLCDNPSPQSGGRGCLGDAEQQRDCNTHLCTVGPWLPWSQWSECSVSCGGGQQYHSHVCSSPACSGLSRQSKICNTHVCLGLLPVQYLYPCSLSCGGLGLKTRSRGCTQPAPAHGGRDCQGPRRETTYCQAPDCPGTLERLCRTRAVCNMCSSGMKVRFMKSCFSPPATVVPTEEPATPGRFKHFAVHSFYSVPLVAFFHFFFLYLCMLFKLFLS